jgi:hypothetical protein
MQAARGRRGGRTSVAAIERAGRERKAIALRQQGLSFEEIAGELGYGDRSGARKAVERGLSRWMRENDEELRARELERTELIIDRLWPLIDREAPDLKALDRLLKTMDHRAKITGLYGKRAAPPDTYAGAPDRAAETKAQLVVRYQELIEQMYLGVLESGYGSGVAPPGDDDDDDARFEVPSSDVTVADDELLEDDELLDGMRWVDGKPVWDGNWVDGKFVRSTADVSEDLTLHRRPARPTEQETSSGEPLRAEALNINSDA